MIQFVVEINLALPTEMAETCLMSMFGSAADSVGDN